MQKRYQIIVSGKVQGVGFRMYSKNEADALGLSGYVRNQADGNVYIEAEGDTEKLESFVKWCHQGTPLAKVAEVSINKLGLKSDAGFDIRFRDLTFG